MNSAIDLLEHAMVTLMLLNLGAAIAYKVYKNHFKTHVFKTLLISLSATMFAHALAHMVLFAELVRGRASIVGDGLTIAAGLEVLTLGWLGHLIFSRKFDTATKNGKE